MAERPGYPGPAFAGTPRVGGILAAAAFSAAWVALNANKPVHTDDAFQLYWARAIAPLSGETAPRLVNWIRFEEPLLAETQHYMPGWAMLLAAARRSAGPSEVTLHWLQWPFAVMLLAGVAALARTFGAPVRPALLVCGSSPAFLLPAASLMGDLPAAGLGVLGLAVWTGTASLPGRVAGGLLLALACQMKQTALVLYPLLLLTPAGRLDRRPGSWAVAAVSLALAGWYPDVPPHDPGRATVLGHVLWIIRNTWEPVLWRPRLSYLAATAAGVLLTPLALAWVVVARREPRAAGDRIRSVSLALLCIPGLAALGFWKRARQAGVVVEDVPASAGTLWWYLAIGVFLSWLALAAGSRRPGPAGTREPARAMPRYLVAWFALNAAGFVAATPTPSVRHLIPALPPLALLFLLDLKAHCGAGAARAALALAVGGNAWLGLSLARNDYRFAAWSRRAAAAGAEAAAARGLPLMTTGSWGLRWYVERQGGTMLGRSSDPVPGGAVMLCPERTDHRTLPAALRRRARRLSLLVCPPSRNMPWVLPVQTVPPARAVSAFHGGHLWFPYAFSRAPLETVEVLEIAPLRRAGESAREAGPSAGRASPDR